MSVFYDLTVGRDIIAGRINVVAVLVVRGATVSQWRAVVEPPPGIVWTTNVPGSVVVTVTIVVTVSVAVPVAVPVAVSVAVSTALVRVS